MVIAAPSNFVSQAEFARRRKVSRKTVTEWKSKGLLTLSDAGLIDVEATEWALDQRPSKYRGGVTHRPVRADSGNKGPVQKPPARQAPDNVDGDEPLDLSSPDLPLAEAVRRKENFLGLQRKQELERNEGKLVDREAAEKLFFDTARDFRDAWQSWPARIAVEMADELNVDPRALTTILNAHVRQHLTELGDPPANFG